MSNEEEEERKINLKSIGVDDGDGGKSSAEVVTTTTIGDAEKAFHPKNKKIPIFVLSLVFTLLLSGIFMGWSSLLIPMREEGVYAWYCNGTDTNTTDITNSSNSRALGCVEQELRLNFIYSLTIFAMCVFSIVDGVIVDVLGHKALATMGSVMLLGGFLLVAFSSRTFEAYIPGFMLFALGGGAQYFSTMVLGGLFGKRVGTYVSILNASFDASLVVFSVFLLIRESSHSGEDPSLKAFFIAFSALPIAFWIFSRTWPRKVSVSAFDPDKIEEIEDSASKSARIKTEWLEVRQAIFSWKYVLFALWASLNMLTLNHYLGAVPSMLSYQIKAFASGNPDYDYEQNLERLTKILNWILSIAIIVSPGIGWLIDNTHPAVYCLITQLFGIVTGILKLLPGNPYFQVITFLVYSVYRMLFYATACTCLIYYYGMEKIGRTWGIGLFFAGTVSLLQYPLNSMTELRFGGNYFIANLIQLVYTVLFLIFPIYLWRERIASAKVEYDKQTDPI